MEFTREMFRPKIYTSYLSKMCEENKFWDTYIQVSRTVFCPRKNTEGIKITELIDFNLGNVFGMWQDSMERYYKYQLSFAESYSCIEKIFKFQDERADQLICYYGESEDAEEALKTLNRRLKSDDRDAVEIYGLLNDEMTWPKIVLLCHENLESKYTAQDEKKYKDNKAGEYKRCHRRILAKFIQDNYDEFIPEWNISEDNRDIVYRDYF